MHVYQFNIWRDVVVDKKVFREAEAANYICMSRSFLSQDRVNGVLA